ncbi:hypothetical protein [Saccharopolyspora sp. SCSIO 74807]|uniref:hypothetical protein n=1 Tax=Saccharopolyspora sp. SCSIO 74807 TaxID=3118084 RepID=UPI0030CDB4F1
MDGRTYVDRIAATRSAAFGSSPLSSVGRCLIRNAEFQDVAQNEDDPGDLVRWIAQHGADAIGELKLYAQYGMLIESIGTRFGRYPAFGPEDGHQEGVLALLEMARAGAADFTRRVKRSITYRVSTEASRLSRAVTGFSRDQVRTVYAALEQAAHDHQTAREFVLAHPDVNRRMRADTFDAIAALLQPAHYTIDDALNDHADPWLDEAAAYVDELLSHETVSEDEHELLCRAYGLYGFAPHTDHDLGQHLGVDRSVAGKARRRALATLRAVAKDVAA